VPADPLPIPVKAKAALVDARTLEVLWANEPAPLTGATGNITLEDAVPVGAALGLEEAVREVAATGEARHLRANLVSTSKGSMAIASSVYPLPNATILILVENAWQTANKRAGRDR